MSHLRLYQEGKISRTEYETLSNLKRSGQRGLYRLYEGERRGTTTLGEAAMKIYQRSPLNDMGLTIFCNRCGFHHSPVRHLKELLAEWMYKWFGR